MVWGMKLVLQRAKLSFNEENSFVCETRKLGIKASKKLEKKVKQSYDT
jgi:hypothetical protein